MLLFGELTTFLKLLLQLQYCLILWFDSRGNAQILLGNTIFTGSKFSPGLTEKMLTDAADTISGTLIIGVEIEHCPVEGQGVLTLGCNEPVVLERIRGPGEQLFNAAAPVAEKPAVVVTQKVAPGAAIERPTDISQARAQALRVQAETQMNSLVDGLGQTPKSDLLAARETVAEDRPGALSAALKGYAKTASEPARASVGFDAVI